MKFKANNKKKVEIKVGEDIYLRHAIKTKFVTPKDNYIDILQEYVSKIYEKGDILSISEKIISICQNRIVRKEDVKPSLLAKLLSRFASRTSAGVGVSEALKMQFAINQAGVFKVIFASILSGITKIFGIKGVFYKIVGQEVSGLDGFYDHVWKEYGDIGIMLPENPNKVCNEIYNKLGFSCMIVDANDLGQEILGKSHNIKYSDDFLKKLIKDNPAGQGRQTTPIILIRKK